MTKYVELVREVTGALVKHQSKKPTRKVVATGVAGALTVAGVAAFNYYFPGLGEVVSPTIEAGAVALVAAVAGYFTKDRKQEVV